MLEILTPLFSSLSGPEERNFWMWLGAALLLAVVLYHFWRPPATPASIHLHPSAVLDYKYLLVQRVVNVLILGPLLLSALALGNSGSKLLASWLGPGPQWTVNLPVILAFAVLHLLLFDIGHYASHWIHHHVPFFWEIHKLHHSAEVLTPATAYRGHPVEILMDALLTAPLQAAGLAIFYYLCGGVYSLTAFTGAIVVIGPYYLLASLRHSHVWISFGPKLEHVFSSPAQHQIHHSRAERHLNTNLSQYFSFLDWIFGTLYVPTERETLDFGLDEGPDPELTTVWSFYWVPVRRAFEITSRRAQPQSRA